MEMTDMKLPKKSEKEMKNMGMPATSSGMQDEYPYGLRISLNNEQLAKLNIGAHNVGDEIEIEATGSIISKSENEQQGGKAEKHLEIQIKKICIVCGSDEEYMKDDTPTDKRIAMSRNRQGKSGGTK